MDLKSSSITADILNVLMDGKIHTLQSIANEVEVSKWTVHRHIKSLACRYPIETFTGGDKRGGVCLDKKYIAQGRIFTKAELQFGAKIFGSLQRADYHGEELKSLDTFLKLFAAYIFDKED